MTLKLIDELKDFSLESDLFMDLSLSRDIPFTPSLVGWAIINRFYSRFSEVNKRSIHVSLFKRRVK